MDHGTVTAFFSRFKQHSITMFAKQLYLQDATIDSVYFPLTCGVSVLVGVRDGTKVEMPTVGNEGLPVPVTASSARNTSDCVRMNPQSGSFHPWPATYVYAIVHNSILMGKLYL